MKSLNNLKMFKRYQNSVNTTYSYRTDNYRLTRISSPSILDLRYGYDAVGNIVSLNDSITGGNVSYGYDGLNRLTSATEAGGFQQSFIYSSIGNILSIAGSDNLAYFYGNGAGPHAVTSLWYTDKDLCKTGDLTVIGFIETVPECSQTDRTLTYDSNGNMLTDGFFLFGYDETNMLARVKNATTNITLEEYEYDHTGDRILKTQYSTINATTYYFSKEYEETLYSNGTITRSTFVFVNGERVAEIRDGVKIYYLDDHLGSSSVVLNESGGVIDRIKYYPFGQIKTRTGSITDYLYNSKEQDNTNLLYYGVRYYNPTLMRWTQPDTIIQDNYDPQTLNRYSYARNNPLKYTDPTGHYASIYGVSSSCGLYAPLDRNLINDISLKDLTKGLGLNIFVGFGIASDENDKGTSGVVLSWSTGDISPQISLNAEKIDLPKVNSMKEVAGETITVTGDVNPIWGISLLKGSTAGPSFGTGGIISTDGMQVGTVGYVGFSALPVSLPVGIGITKDDTVVIDTSAGIKENPTIYGNPTFGLPTINTFEDTVLEKFKMISSLHKTREEE